MPGRKWLACAVTAALALGADQALKHWLLAELPPGSELRWLGGLLVLAPTQQEGSALGLLSGLAPAWAEPVLWALAGLAALLLAQWLWRAPAGDRLSGTAAGLILGGAGANALDRLRHGAVIEYARIDLQVLPLPEFNLADFALVLGLALLLLDLVAEESGPPAAPEAPRPGGLAPK
jgi:signal peptidase II